MSVLTRLLERRRPTVVAAPDAAPFVHVQADGRVDLATVVEAAAVRCALSRLCAYCAQPQGFPLVFVGPVAELDGGRCRRPGMHDACARLAVERYRAAGLLHLPWALQASGSFTVERPQTRGPGEQIRFRPGPLLWTERVP
ncbi:hypothetical protein ACIB24_09695 [Spongisporangium articulatum]|uniref:Uncharacterized protein n=1 Tax=Spongisporangium articulatum TaxID=3362603 RepID=A0ABW8AMY7_9ACTN